jgi:hypothetical protein
MHVNLIAAFMKKNDFFLQKVNSKAWPEEQQSRGFLSKFNSCPLSSLYFAKPVRIRFVKFGKFTTPNFT